MLLKESWEFCLYHLSPLPNVALPQYLAKPVFSLLTSMTKWILFIITLAVYAMFSCTAFYSSINIFLTFLLTCFPVYLSLSCLFLTWTKPFSNKQNPSFPSIPTYFHPSSRHPTQESSLLTLVFPTCYPAIFRVMHSVYLYWDPISQILSFPFSCSLFLLVVSWQNV